MKKIIVVAVLLLWTGIAGAGTDLLTGGGHIDGHSYSGDYSVDPGFFWTGQLERKIDRWSTDGGLLTSTYGLQYIYSRFERQDHQDVKSAATDNVSTTSSHIPLAFYKLRVMLYKRVSIFASAGGGYEFASDDGDGWAGTAAGGVEFKITDKWAAVGQYQKVVTQTRWFDMPSVMLKYSF